MARSYVVIFAVIGHKTINIPGILQGFKVFRFHSEFVVDVYKKDYKSLPAILNF